MAPSGGPAKAPGTGKWALPYLTAKPREEIELERGLLIGIAAFRWGAWTWAAVAFAIDAANEPYPAHRIGGLVLLAVALAWTSAASVLVRVGASMLLDRWALAIELAIGATLMFADWWVYGVADAHSQSLGSVWPVAGVLSVGAAYAGRDGFVTGALLGLSRLAGQLVFLGTDQPFGATGRGDDKVAAVGTIVMYALAGAVGGFVTIKLRETERQVAIARAREEVATTLHDGVLQTLAIVQRRSHDADLVALAREQEGDLREFLFRKPPDPRRLFRKPAVDLVAQLREAVTTAETRHGIRGQVVCPADPPLVPAEVAEAVAGAVGEALTNAAKHGGARQATVFVEPDENGSGFFCSIKDDGQGFEPGEAIEGVGITKSIRGRIDDIGGEVEIDGRPGRGTEVRIRVGSI